MIQLACKELKKYYGAQMVLSDVTFEIQEGEHVAIVGKNGSGKSTVFRVITGQEGLDGGNIAIRKGSSIGYLEQIPVYEDELTVRQIIELVFTNLIHIREKLRTLEEAFETAGEEQMEHMLKQYNELGTQYELEGGYEMEERFSKICSGLKLTEEFLSQKFMQLSGGEKTLAVLAKVLLQDSDLLLLDEPTNHLDLSMLQWLEEYLKNYKGAVLVISHDRYFLNLVAKRVIEIEDGKSTVYQGNYQEYVTQKNKRREEQIAAYKEQQKKVKQMERAITRMRQWASMADNEKMFKRAENMKKRLERMDKVEKPKAIQRGMVVEFDDQLRSGKDVLSIDGLEKSYGDIHLFHGMSLEVYYKEHVAILGRNGCGKSTLLKMILGEEQPDGGVIGVGSSLKIGYLPQVVCFQQEDRTILETFREDQSIPEGKARELLARYLFYGESVFQKVGNLSGGEKSRLKLAILMQQEVNFLILDEPTNHLDILSREKLEEALLLFQGTLLFVSHDRYFVNRIATRILELENGVTTNYNGDFNYYQEEKEIRSAKKPMHQIVDTKKRKETLKHTEHEKKKKQEAVNPYQIQRLESEMQMLEQQIKEQKQQITESSNNYIRLMELTKVLEEQEGRYEEVLKCWMELMEA